MSELHAIDAQGNVWKLRIELGHIIPKPQRDLEIVSSGIEFTRDLPSLVTSDGDPVTINDDGTLTAHTAQGDILLKTRGRFPCAPPPAS